MLLEAITTIEYKRMNTILSGQSLVDMLREHCDQAKERIWIASPYIGTSKMYRRSLVVTGCVAT